jgi:hypothetical protein
MFRLDDMMSHESTGLIVELLGRVMDVLVADLRHADPAMAL